MMEPIETEGLIERTIPLQQIASEIPHQTTGAKEKHRDCGEDVADSCCRGGSATCTYQFVHGLILVALFLTTASLVAPQSYRVEHGANETVATNDCDIGNHSDTIKKRETWKRLKAKMCPNLVPSKDWKNTLFHLARDELNMADFDGPKKSWGRTRLFEFVPERLNALKNTRDKFAFAYIRIFKAANNQIGAWQTTVFEHIVDKGNDWVVTQMDTQKGSDWRTLGAPNQPCLVTAIRDPVSHFLSGYNEIEWRYQQQPVQSHPSTPRWLFTRYDLGSRERFSEFLNDYLLGEWEEGWDAERLQLGHVASMAGVLTVLAHHGLYLTDYLPSIENVTVAWPPFVAETCFNGYQEIIPLTPMKTAGKHESSSDPYGTYQAAKEVWRQQGETARALCALHALDYACFDHLPHGVPDLCLTVFTANSFVERIIS